MLLRQVFKTSEGARKHAAFENNHRNQRGPRGANYFWYTVRCLGPDSQPDTAEFDVKQFAKYTWRVAKRPL